MKYILKMLLVIMSFSVFAKDVYINKKNKNDLDSILLEVGEWRDIGPFRGGRSTTATGITGNDQIYYMGTTGGGLWKTYDAGLSWKNVSDGFLLLVQWVQYQFQKVIIILL